MQQRRRCTANKINMNIEIENGQKMHDYLHEIVLDFQWPLHTEIFISKL